MCCRRCRRGRRGRGSRSSASFSPRLPAGGVFPAAGAVVREAGAVAVGEEEVDAGAPLVELAAGADAAGVAVRVSVLIC